MITFQVHPEGALLRLAQAENQAGFAVSLALNRLANDVQAAEREGLKRHFKLRREAFNLRGIKIAKQDRANKTTWRVVIQVAPEVNYFDKFEEGGYKLPHGGKYIWVPSREFKSRIIGAGDPLHPKNLTFTKNAAGQMKGSNRTFMVRSDKGDLLVLQRVDRRLSKKGLARAMRMTLDEFKGGQGPARKGEKYSLKRTAGVRLLYTLKQRVRVQAQLQFVPIAKGAVEAGWAMHMQQAFDEAMRSAR